jgi:CBS domain-containing protein
VAVLIVVAAIWWARAQPGASLTSLVFGIFLALFIWQGASQALQIAAVRTRLPRLMAGSMARPAVGVPPDMPLAEALRRLHAAGARGIVVVSSTGIPEAVVVEQAVSATPEHRRPWVSVGAVARSVGEDLTLPADLGGEELVEAMQTHPASEYVVVDRRGGLVGVLSVRDVAAVLDPAAAR